MSDHLKIKLSIADRLYPLTIKPQQEEGLRKAAKEIEEMIKKFEQSYAVRDKQDVLAMCALQFASKTIQRDIEGSGESTEAIQQLRDLELLVKSQLS
ncbi:cell division protein ZapA [Leeuwenhoekiella sp. W20_SRS_FM14]|uniref:cell division protein ZapA n=1 Tax=Leeuwenhoekiella sp. W20_SRS_FM14 TaxID=3240270 RepID=UPI003F9CA8D0